VFYFDHNYLENMLFMFRKVNAKERVVGFYSTGPSIRPNDLRIHDICQRYTVNSTAPSIFCIIDIRPDRPALPVTAYKVTEDRVGSSDTKTTTAGTSSRQVQRSFAHVPAVMGAMEAEEVGVEHLLRDINDPTVSTVASLIKSKMSGLATLTEKLLECKDYLEAVAAGKHKGSPEIVANLQTIWSLLPNLNHDELVRSMIVKTNDMHMAIYLAALIRSVIALHDLVNNKIRYGEDGTEEEKASAGKEDEKKQDAGDKKKEGTKEKK
jgi:26S proteasome regulatory subunit N8